MPRKRSELKKAAGKLVSAIQKEWSAEAGLDCASESEEILDQSHTLLQAVDGDSFDASVLNGSSIAQFLGESWVSRHPRVIPAIEHLHRCIKESNTT
jgi:hypothetical protein